jgi:hypothetical protein
MRRKQLETAAAYYAYLRGLFLLPGGALAIVAALGNWHVGPLRHDWVFVLAVAVLGGVALLVNRFYVTHYGRLTLSGAEQLRVGAGVVVAAAIMLGGALLLRSRASWSLDLPVNAIAVAFAVIMLLAYEVGIGLRPHQVAIWGVVLFAGALPVWTGPDPSNVGLLIVGVATIACGPLDHRLLVHRFGGRDAGRLRTGDAGA